ncbi:hypothetical protein EJ06DRAFT_367961 [Trichodelitschia bisporula]|uniref:Cryptic loci regulator 2 N-terminal domain-containing protein n=1 Tax=Trichodelitschia bisporula TaxID=703511 RepID=A0A6G1I1H1_9PEZI|nr:hypothetical protein EJ06DRAFT_367961 [Trichodelitschia bisporula]
MGDRIQESRNGRAATLAGRHYVLNELPHGYRMYSHTNGDRTDFYAWGHPSGKYFNSATSMADHAVHLDKYGNSPPIPCRCRLCKTLPRARAPQPQSNPEPSADVGNAVSASNAEVEITDDVGPISAAGRRSARILARPSAVNTKALEKRTASHESEAVPPKKARKERKNIPVPNPATNAAPDQAPDAEADQETDTVRDWEPDAIAGPKTDEHGAPDVYADLMRAKGNTAEPITEKFSPDYVIGHKGLEYVREQEADPFAPRVGEIVIFTKKPNEIKGVEWIAGMIIPLSVSDSDSNYDGMYHVQELVDPAAVPVNAAAPIHLVHHQNLSPFIMTVLRDDTDSLHPSVAWGSKLARTFSPIEKTVYVRHEKIHLISLQSAFIGWDKVNVGDEVLYDQPMRPPSQLQVKEILIIIGMGGKKRQIQCRLTGTSFTIGNRSVGKSVSIDIESVIMRVRPFKGWGPFQKAWARKVRQESVDAMIDYLNNCKREIEETGRKEWITNDDRCKALGIAVVRGIRVAWKPEDAKIFNQLLEVCKVQAAEDEGEAAEDEGKATEDEGEAMDTAP